MSLLKHSGGDMKAIHLQKMEVKFIYDNCAEKECAKYTRETKIRRNVTNGVEICPCILIESDLQ